MSAAPTQPAENGTMCTALDWASGFLTHTLSSAAKQAPLEPHLLQTLRLAARGLGNAEIASELHLAVETVKTRMSRIYTDLGVKDRTLAVLAGLAGGSVLPDDVLPEGSPATPPRLSPAGAASLTLVTCGLTRQEAAARLGISRETLSSYLRTVMQRLGTDNRSHAAAVAAVLGAIEVPGVPQFSDLRALQVATAGPAGGA